MAVLVRRLIPMAGLIAGLQGCVAAHPLPTGAALRAELDAAAPIRPSPSAELGQRVSQAVHDVEGLGGLTYDDAALAALAIHPALRAARAARGVSRAQIIDAGILPNPQVTGGFDVPTDGAIANTNTAYSTELSWALTPLIARGTAVRAQRSGLDAVELDIAWQEWQVAQSARLGVVRMTYLGRRLALARQTEEEMNAQVQTIEASLNEGNATTLELAAAQSSLQAASLSVLQLLQQQRAARLAWLAALGLPPTSPAGVADDPRLPSRGELPALPSLLDRVEDARLDLAGLRRGYDAADGRARAAALRAFPPITVAARRAVDNSQLGTLGLGVTIELPFFDRNQGQTALDTATRDQLYESYLATVQDARAQVALAHADLVSVREQLALVRGWVPTLDALVAASEQLVGSGNVSIVDLYDLRLRLLDTRLLLEELEQSELETSIALELASGVPWNP